MEENTCAALWSNQVGYITLIAQLPGIHGNVNCPCPLAMPLDSGRFTAIVVLKPCKSKDADNS